MMCPRCGNNVTNTLKCPVCGYDLTEEYADLKKEREEKANLNKANMTKTKVPVKKENQEFSFIKCTVGILSIILSIGLLMATTWYFINKPIESSYIQIIVFILLGIVFLSSGVFLIAGSNIKDEYIKKYAVYFYIIGVLIALIGSIMIVVDIVNKTKGTLFIAISLLIIGIILFLTDVIIEKTND